MEKLSKLFEKWQEKYEENGIKGEFVKDGIVDKENYKKIVWILKETNDYDKPINELIYNVVRNNKKSGLWRGITWHNVGRATAKLINPEISFNEAHKNRKKYLLNIAVINIKKTTGSSKSKDKEINSFAKDYADFIIEELKILEPEKVVLGGTFSYLKDILQLEKFKNNIYKSKLFPDTIFIKAHHPGTREKKTKYFQQF